jgi:hypothetical protein
MVEKACEALVYGRVSEQPYKRGVYLGSPVPTATSTAAMLLDVDEVVWRLVSEGARHDCTIATDAAPGGAGSSQTEVLDTRYRSPVNAMLQLLLGFTVHSNLRRRSSRQTPHVSGNILRDHGRKVLVSHALGGPRL